MFRSKVCCWGSLAITVRKRHLSQVASIAGLRKLWPTQQVTSEHRLKQNAWMICNRLLDMDEILEIRLHKILMQQNSIHGSLAKAVLTSSGSPSLALMVQKLQEASVLQSFQHAQCPLLLIHSPLSKMHMFRVSPTSHPTLQSIDAASMSGLAKSDWTIWIVVWPRVRAPHIIKIWIKCKLCKCLSHKCVSKECRLIQRILTHTSVMWEYWHVICKYQD